MLDFNDYDLVNYMRTKYNCNFYVRDGEGSTREVACDVLIRIQVEFSLCAIESELILCRLRIQEEFAQERERKVTAGCELNSDTPVYTEYIHNIYMGAGARLLLS
jgi:hypothetical protein